MPEKNRIKSYIERGYYHIYNRGVDKRTIFQDREDYSKFLYFLKIYLSPPENIHEEYPLLKANIVNHNLYGEVDLLAFCLMPNHFHLLVQQKNKDGIIKLTRRVLTSYSQYFNRRHERVGPLFQSAYKAALVDSDEYLLHLSRYIHLNPLDRGASLDEFEWSSYLYYLEHRKAHWLTTKTVLNYFSKKKEGLTYRSFVEDYKDSPTLPLNLTIE